MMSSEATSSPVSASTLAYLMRWPVLRLIWLKVTFSVSDVAGYRATGQVTSERRKKPFQLARGAMGYSENAIDQEGRIPPGNRVSSDRGGESLNGVNRGGDGTACPEMGSQAARPVPRSSGEAGRQDPEHHLRSCVWLHAPQGLTGISRDYPGKSRATWQRDGTIRSSKPRPRHARPSPGRWCSLSSRSQPGSRCWSSARSGSCSSAPEWG